jgi:hypothetical protein
MIATNAQKIIDVRAQGFRPDEMILVSLIGRINEQNHTVYAGSGRDYEWQWAHDLQVCIYASSGVDWQKSATAIAHAKPSYLALWDTGRNEGAELWYEPAVESIDLSKSQWQYKFNYMPWTPAQNERFAQ